MSEGITVGNYVLKLGNDKILMRGFMEPESGYREVSSTEAIALASVLLAFARELRGGEG